MKKALTYIVLVLLVIGCKEQVPDSINDFPKSNNIEFGPWTFCEAGKVDWKPATVPGVIHLDLLNNDIIDDPFWENNEHKQRWIEDKNWDYKSSFEISDSDLENDHIEIDFEGLDTYAEVYINKHTVLNSSNMFVSHQVDIKKHVQVGKNEILVRFTSPILYNKEAVENYPIQLPSGNETADIETKVAAFTRKAAYHFGWDWGPRFVTCGIWKPVRITTWNELKILDAAIITEEIRDNEADVVAKLRIDSDKEQTISIDLFGESTHYKLSKGINLIERVQTIKNPKLWWCNGSGAPAMHSENVQIKKNGQVIASKEIKYGIRTIELINETDSIGTSFYFKLNGQPTFMKGGNYIPQDVFLPRVTDDQYNKLIQQIKDANMNMIRVWGGGVYEKDLFYDLCDQNGILVWQDFMFAGSLYPSSKWFFYDVSQEVEQQLYRLRKHPCIAVWCGNNEIEVAWNNWGWQKQYNYSPEDSTRAWATYERYFKSLIPGYVASISPETPYTSTSPLSNWGTPENFNHSSMHYWGVWHGKEPFENFEKNVGRFMVEYGFQSYPEMATLNKVAHDSSMYLNSEVMKNRQKSYIGNGLIEKHILQYEPQPKSFEEFVQASQRTQARGMKMAIDAHVKNQPHCMGSLFWQINDCWPGPSWSVIDYYGNTKVAYDSVRVGFE